MRARIGLGAVVGFGLCIVACSTAPGSSPPVPEGATATLDKPAQPGEKGCGPKIHCDDGNPCTVDSCVRGQGCVFTPADGAACDDGNACTTVDSCVGSTCVGSSPVVCTGADQCQAAGACDPTTGACSNTPVPDGTACDDQNACTQTDACSGGVCVGGSPVTCSPSDACHSAGVCDPVSGACSNPTTYGNAAPGGGWCAGGVVVMQPPSVSGCGASLAVTCPTILIPPAVAFPTPINDSCPGSNVYLSCTCTNPVEHDCTFGYGATAGPYQCTAVDLGSQATVSCSGNLVDFTY